MFRPAVLDPFGIGWGENPFAPRMDCIKQDWRAAQ